MPPTESSLVLLFCFKSGVLSRAGHDLRLSVRPARLEWSDKHLTAWFRAQDIQVDGAIVHGEVKPALLSKRDHRNISTNLNEKVLETSRFPEIRVKGSAVDGTFSGELLLKGCSRPIQFPYEIHDTHSIAKVEIVPSKWGIKPFRALFGALQLQDRIRVEIQIPNS